MKKLIKKLKVFPSGSVYIELNKGVDTKEEFDEYCKALDREVTSSITLKGEASNDMIAQIVSFVVPASTTGLAAGATGAASSTGSTGDAIRTRPKGWSRALARK